MKTAQTKFFATISSAPVFLFACVNFLRFLAARKYWETLQQLNADPLYLAGSGLGWSLTFFILLWTLIKGWKFAPLAGVLISPVYFAFYWFERLRLQDSPAKNLPFSVITSILVFLVVTALFLMAAKEESK